MENTVLIAEKKQPETTTPSPANWVLPVLAVAAILSLGLNGYQAVNLQELRQQVGGVSKQVGEFRESLARVDQSTVNHIGTVRQEVDSVRTEAKQSALTVGKAAQSAVRKNAELVSKLAKREVENNLKVHEELAQVKATTEQAAGKITDVSSEVGNVKTDVASAKTDIAATKNDISQTASELHRATGDLGIMSGLIATNSKELQGLRELGEREYFEFRIVKNTLPQRVGDIQLALKKSDIRRNRFTVEVMTDDKRIEKKDKTINEPVQFYVPSKARQPYEIVINQVTKDSVTGYLAKPKATVARR